ncbi:uncharacterized protein LOC102800591 [Saccoglossus kowalevskii]|uniref:Uncharacterized protein LOC102800591 n=1 Tax=Saccoglossus kowalevskii TaxID=10224 RepID=A0ABM0M7G3_SACKO|nr:PREDICTED: uncharacterized protein LOC102800591 [Saccoglossus kowalevskii]
MEKLLEDYSPRVLVRTMVFLNSKQFGLKSRMGHRALRCHLPQITLHESPGETPHLKYVEDVSKSKQGGLKHRRVRRKEVMHYANAILECTRSTRHSAHLRETNYLQPRRKYEESDKIWFTKQQMGYNSIQLVVPDLLRSAGIVGNFTNHSLRATAATSLYEHGVDEQLIMERAGHRSVEGYQLEHY